MKAREYFWIDKSTLYILIMLGTIMLLVSLFSKTFIFIVLMVVPFVFCAQWRPIIVKDGYFIMAPYNFPSIRRCRVPVGIVKTLSLWMPDKFFYNSRAGKTKFIIIEDSNGRRYRNMIWSPAEFRRGIEGMLAAGVIDKDWLDRIPKSLRPDVTI